MITIFDAERRLDDVRRQLDKLEALLTLMREAAIKEESGKSQPERTDWPALSEILQDELRKTNAPMEEVECFFRLGTLAALEDKESVEGGSEVPAENGEEP
jgi:hypothetical protein